MNIAENGISSSFSSLDHGKRPGQDASSPSQGNRQVMEEPNDRMESIGGFFGLELPAFDHFPQDHGEKSIMVNSGRCALEYILRSLDSVSHIHVPYYTCATILEPLLRLGIQHSFYRIDDSFEIDSMTFPQVKDGEWLLYTNYFGLKQAYVEKLASRLPGKLIVDHCQALYAKVLPGVPAIFSPRKWSGLPDGGVAVLDAPAWEISQTDQSSQAATCLLRALESGVEAAAQDCEQSEARLKDAPLMKMSTLTRKLMRGVNYEEAAEKRRENFLFLHERIGALNKWSLKLDGEFVPFCYPFWTNFPELRNHLIDHGILIPCLWEDLPAPAPPQGIEAVLVAGVLPLPVDQRYSMRDMERVANVIDSFYS